MASRVETVTSVPGSTMSPRPSSENSYLSAQKSFGIRTLMGASNDLATVTMTLVPNTQKMSYKNKPP